MIIHTLNLFKYLVFLIFYLVKNNPSDIILDGNNVEEYPKTISYNIYNLRKYEQLGIFDEYKAFRFLFPGNFYKYDLSEKKTEAVSWWYSQYDFYKYSEGDNKSERKFLYKYKSYEDYLDEYDKHKDDENWEDRLLNESIINVTHYLGNINYNDNNKKYKFLFFTTGAEPQYSPRFSGGYLGVAKFEKNQKKWILKEFYPKTEYYGFMGSANIPKKILKLKENSYSFYIKVLEDDGVSGADINPLYSYSIILQKKSNKYKEIFYENVTDLKNAYNTGGTEWSSDIVVDKKHKSFGMYNIRLEINGLLDPIYIPDIDVFKILYKSNMFKTKELHKFRVTKYYKFNGNKYVKFKSEFFEL